MSNVSQNLWGWKYCNTPIQENQRATNLEIFLPPFLMIFAFFIGLILIYIKTVHSKDRTDYEDHASIDDLKNLKGEAEQCWPLLDDGNFLSDFDKEALRLLAQSGYGIRDLVVLLLPTFCSVCSSCLVLLAYDPVVHCFWPSKARSSATMNAVISSFIIPAGFVYALSFGFMFQFAMEKYAACVDKVTTEISLIDQMVTMTSKMTLPSTQHTMAILKAIKAECMCVVVLVQNKRLKQFKSNPPKGMQVALWHIMDIMRDAQQQQQGANSLLIQKMATYAVKLNNITTDKMGSLHDGIHLFTWFFLEILGCITLFSMMLVFAQSFKMELAICHLTLFSVAMLCYVLSDLDKPFSGFFHIDLSALPDVVRRIERLYDSARQGWPLDITYDKDRDRVLQVIPSA